MALELARDIAERWRATHPAVARWNEDGTEGTLAHVSFPAAHRRKIRSTSGWKRFNQEIKRRTRVMRIFPNRAACLRLVTASCVEQSEEWLGGKLYLDMSHLERAEDAAQGAIAASEEAEGDMAAQPSIGAWRSETTERTGPDSGRPYGLS